ncbi:MAG: aminotransferase class V-fold PLP-dependent enzyme, partial [Candidatus Aminicenantes bacterium]|nr:aminotransferase class V-fold PLP-dependent enzyme [Candidatus Aminicenantes bacterium]
RVETNKNEPPWKFEMGMLNNTSLAALGAGLEYLLGLADLVACERDSPQTGAGPVWGRSLTSAGPEAANPDRSSKFRLAMNAIAEYETGLSRSVLEGFRNFDPGRFRVFGISEPSRAGERVPTFAFDVAGLGATETKKRLWEDAGIQIADGNHYSAAVVRHLGRPEGICRASFAHYDNLGTVDRFLEALGRLMNK